MTKVESSQAQDELDLLIDKLVIDVSSVNTLPVRMGIAGRYKRTLQSLIKKEKHDLIDRIEASIQQHTVPEGWDLASKSYIRNTLEFEREQLQQPQQGG